jgi:hypothetical protein
LSLNTNSAVKGKWSVAQNTAHLNIALLRLSNYLALPKSGIASSFGLSDRASASYAAAMALFKTTLGTRVTAAPGYEPQENLETSVRDLVDQERPYLRLSFPICWIGRRKIWRPTIARIRRWEN